jgi:PAS domain S-box-containing protein
MENIKSANFFRSLDKFIAEPTDMERFFELPLDMLCIANMTGKFIKVSKSLVEMMGYSEVELLSRPFTDFIVSEDQGRTDIAYNELKKGKSIKNFENRYQCKDGSVKWLSWHSVAVPEEGIIYAIARDITEIKMAQNWHQQYTEQLEELLKQKEESLRYARYLQTAITPDMDSLHHILPQSFIYSAPKEIVSGDFFWMETLSSDGKLDKDGNLVLIAVADCTGHGVPAAMLTVMCSTALNKVVKEFGIIEPAKILDTVCDNIQDRFAKGPKQINDGMDVSLCLLDKNTGKIKWAGANTPLYYVKDGHMHEMTADKQPIGKYPNRKPFTNHEIDLSKGDTIYLFSDGYASQFGGEKGKKFMSVNFRDLLAGVSCLSTPSQKKIVSDTFETWKGELEQTDDVTVVGIKL